MTYIVVFDTNILFSGFGWRGNPFRCLQLAREGKVVSLTCREILAEFEEKLRLKRNMPAIHAARAVTEVLSFSRLVAITNTLKVVNADPDAGVRKLCFRIISKFWSVRFAHRRLRLTAQSSAVQATSSQVTTIFCR